MIFSKVNVFRYQTTCRYEIPIDLKYLMCRFETVLLARNLPKIALRKHSLKMPAQLVVVCSAVAAKFTWDNIEHLRGVATKVSLVQATSLHSK